MPLSATAATAKDAGKLAPMQHRHFATIATIIARLDDPAAREIAADHFARQLASTNPRFDACRFLRACGIA